jgi:hypothetical protein
VTEIPVPVGEWRRVRDRARARQRRRTGVATGALVLLVGAPLAVAGVLRVQSGGEQGRTTLDAAAGLISTPPQTLGRDHVDGPVQYASMPPVGGDHAPEPQTCGVYDGPIRTENAVHSMEHGAVWLTYRLDGSPSDETTNLERLVEAGAPYVLLSPLPEQTEDEVVASAWGVQLRVDSADDPRLAAFVEAYANGPQAPEPGAACVGTEALRGEAPAG